MTQEHDEEQFFVKHLEQSQKQKMKITGLGQNKEKKGINNKENFLQVHNS